MSEGIRPLDGKTALVTGAARGIGRVTAHALAKAGARTAVIDILPEAEETARLIRKGGGEAVAVQLDIADSRAVNDGVQRVHDALGPVAILVNNAGIVNNIAPFHRMEQDDWTREISVNLGGPFNMIQAVIEPMIAASWGRIINVSSLAALGGLQYQVGYASSKAGLLGLSKTVALEYARYGITCNAILPGLIATELVQQMPAEIRNNALRMIPAGRTGTMEEVAALVVFLASEEAAFINGAEIAIDGGARLNTTTLGSRREARRQTRSSSNSEEADL